MRGYTHEVGNKYGDCKMGGLSVRATRAVGWCDRMGESDAGPGWGFP